MRSTPPGRIVVRSCLAPVALALAALSCTSSDELTDEERYDVYMTNATRYYEAQRYPEAEQQARKSLALQPGAAEANLVLGWSMLYQGTPSKLEAAERHFQACFADDPSDFRYGLGLGFSRFGLGKMRLDRAETLRSTEPTSDLTAEDLAAQAAADHAAGIAKLDEARVTLEDALSVQPDYPPALACLGQIHMLCGRYDEAIAKFEKYLPIAERSRQGHEELAKTLRDEFERQLHRDKIKSNLAKEIEVRKAVANIRYKQRRYTEAIAQLEIVLQLQPDEEEALFNLGQCHYQLAEYEESKKVLQRFLAVTLRPFDEMVKRSYDLIADIDKRANVAREVAPATSTDAPK
jgi:tetratricopeptide (TPR) repeat protein